MPPNESDALPESISKLRVIVITAVRLYREGLSALLSGQDEVQIVATAASAGEGQRCLMDVQPDLVLIDSVILLGSTFAKECHSALPRTKILAFGVREENEDEILACAEAGVAGFLTCEASFEELSAALQAATCGNVHCTPRIAGLIVRRVASLAASHPSITSRPALTPREVEVLDLIATGVTNKDIARRLKIESATVKNHVHNVLEKLQVQRRGEAVAFMRNPPRLGSIRPYSADISSDRGNQAKARGQD
jgi:two-component system nitrate/nitrite response regulator NarL